MMNVNINYKNLSSVERGVVVFDRKEGRGVVQGKPFKNTYNEMMVKVDFGETIKTVYLFALKLVYKVDGTIARVEDTISDVKEKVNETKEDFREVVEDGKEVLTVLGTLWKWVKSWKIWSVLKGKKNK